MAGGSLVLTRAGRMAISLRCPLAETLGCRGVVRLETVRRFPSGAGRAAPRRVLRLGAAHFRIGGGQTRAVTIVVSPRGRALVRRLGRVPVRAVVTAADASGNRRIMRARLRLVRRAPPEGGLRAAGAGAAARVGVRSLVGAGRPGPKREALG